MTGHGAHAAIRWSGAGSIPNRTSGPAGTASAHGQLTAFSTSQRVSAPRPPSPVVGAATSGQGVAAIAAIEVVVAVGGSLDLLVAEEGVDAAVTVQVVSAGAALGVVGAGAEAHVVAPASGVDLVRAELLERVA